MAQELAPLVVIVGPTASGKSDLAMQIAQKYNGEIVCADSRTIYKGMDIGTAKPSKTDQNKVRHHLLDLVKPDQPFSVADFKRLATIAINDIWDRGHFPVMVGGSGLYVDSVLFDYQFGPAANPGQREDLNKLSVQELQQSCETKGIALPENKNNKRHLVRALELGGLLQQTKVLRPNTLVVGITTEKANLLERIKSRAEKMKEMGVLAEVKSLGQKYGWESEAMRGNIYRELGPVIQGELTEKEGFDNFVKSDMRLVKKQITWFKRNKHIIWGTQKDLKKQIDQFIQSYSR